ncbi:MAG: JAB domain-containing protein [Verrucomicrobiae bacterium]|nr:JAB domain-containing protein [Verrucomicrobiae bacterium]
MMREMADSEKPRERLEQLGADALSDRELIAILLRTGKRGLSVLELAQQLLHELGSLEALAKADLGRLRKISGIGKAKAIELKAAFTLAQRLSRPRDERQELSTPRHVADLMRDIVLVLNHEQFHVILLDRKNRLIRAPMKVTQGTLDATVVDARVVFEPALANAAASVVLVHNHPSGDPTPSREDIALTKELVKAGQLLKIEVLDHVIMGRKTTGRTEDFVSLKELHLL